MVGHLKYMEHRRIAKKIAWVEVNEKKEKISKKIGRSSDAGHQK